MKANINMVVRLEEAQNKIELDSVICHNKKFLGRWVQMIDIDKHEQIVDGLKAEIKELREMIKEQG